MNKYTEYIIGSLVYILLIPVAIITAPITPALFVMVSKQNEDILNFHKSKIAELEKENDRLTKKLFENQ